MSLFQFPLSLLGERIGELTVIAAGTFGLATGFLILSKVYTFPLILFSLIFAKGTGGGQHGLSSSLLSRVFEISGRRAAMGTYNFSGDMGKVCFPFLLTLMINWWGWRRVMEEVRRRIPDIVIDGGLTYLGHPVRAVRPGAVAADQGLLPGGADGRPNVPPGYCHHLRCWRHTNRLSRLRTPISGLHVWLKAAGVCKSCPEWTTIYEDE
jgi:MFS family permease